MMSSILRLVILAVFTVSRVVVGHPLLESSGIEIEPPSTDPFYRPPAGWESTKPGAILRQRKVVAAFFGFVPEPIEAHQLLYRTTAMNGSAMATVTTVFKPLHAKTDRFISFHTAYDSVASICNPSYSYRLGGFPLSLVTSMEQFTMQAYLLSGYIVASPDYEGPDAVFGAGRVAGIAALDGMRAVVNFKDTLGLQDKPMIVGTGYSGGAICTGWAASLHSNYAPELSIRGWTQGGTPANLTSSLLKFDKTVFSGLGLTALVGLARPSAYGAELAPLLQRITTSSGQEAMDFVSSHCTAENVLYFAGRSILSTDIQSLGASFLQNPTFISILGDSSMGRRANETPIAPVLLYHTIPDQVIPYSNSLALAKTWCLNGASVELISFAHGGHIGGEILGLPDALKFTDKAFSGNIPSGCSERTELGDTIEPIGFGLDLEPLLTKLLNLLLAFGKDDVNLNNNLAMVSSL